MSSIKLGRPPVAYIYVDGAGIESLYAQIVDSVETSRTTTTQQGVTGKVGAGLRLKNFLVKLVSGLEGEVSTEVTGSHARTEQSIRVETVEQRLKAVVDFLSKSGDSYLFTSLSEASQRLKTAGNPIFIDIRDKFNAPQFYRGCGVDSVNAEGYLLLEKGGTADYSYDDDYYKQPTALVKLSVSVAKMRNGGAMRLSSHEAVIFRGLAGRHVPLSVFGSLRGTSDFLQIKPFAIWM